VSGNKATPQILGTTITVTATATGGTAPYQYKWWVYDGGSWTIGQEWGASNAWTWTPPAPATYQLQVWVRSAGNTLDAAEAYGTLGYGIVPNGVGTYTGAGSATNANCTFPGDNGAFASTGTITIASQTGATFTGTATFAVGPEMFYFAVAGTANAAGQVSGALTFVAPSTLTGTLPFSGALVGKTLAVTFSGQTYDGPNQCAVTGTFTGTRP
jgi:hypothetical protein